MSTYLYYPESKEEAISLDLFAHHYPHRLDKLHIAGSDIAPVLQPAKGQIVYGWIAYHCPVSQAV